MSENPTPGDPQEHLPTDPDEAKAEAKRQRARHWQWYGWAVIGLMIMIIILNLFGVFGPEFNKYAMIGIVLAYGVYVVFRKR